MRIIKDIDSIPEGFTSVVSTGTFDGVHLGHKSIIKEMCMIAHKQNLQSVAITFHPHPRIVLNKDEAKLRLLTTLEEKIAIFEELCLDNLYVIQFTKEFAATPYQAYVRDFLVRKMGAKHIVLGFNHHFGQKRSGNHETLLDLGSQYGYQVTEVLPKDFNKITISSTRIRELIDAQNIELANKLLGYNFSVTGIVVHGKHLGRTLGYPTANIKVDEPYKQIPAVGVYAVNVVIDKQYFNGMCSVGYNPTFGMNDLSIEANIFDFEGDIYEKTIKVVFVAFLRSEIRFANAEELLKQLHEDKKVSLFKLPKRYV